MLYVSPGLNPFWLARKAKLCFPFDRQNAVRFGYARTALEYAFRIIGCQRNDEILIPDYICDVVLHPCNKLGLRARFYQVDDRLAVDLDSAGRLLTGKTKAFLAVNYFGFPQSFEKIKKFCSDNGLLFIEDNSQGYFSKCGSGLLGTFGDFSVFSFRKTLPLRNGAALLVNNPRFIGNLAELQYPTEKEQISVKWYVKRVARWLDMDMHIPLSFLRKEKKIPEHGSTEHADNTCKMSLLSWLLFQRTNMEDEARMRRRNYRKWVSILSSLGAKPVFDELPSGVIPMALPVYVQNRDEWREWGKRNGIETQTWPTLPKWVSENSPSAINRWNRLLLFPVLGS